MRRVLGPALIMLLILLASATPASAAQACSDSTTSLNFGTYTGTLQTSVGTATINCNKNVQYKVGLNAGVGIGATVTTRTMTGTAGAVLNYQMFQDSARTINWGNTSGVDTVSSVGTGSAQAYSIYGQTAAGQFVSPGIYTDTVIENVTGSGSGTSTFMVTATVQAACLVSATAMAFGTYTGAIAISTSGVSITCTNTTPYTVGLSAGLGTGATVTTRKMMTGPGSDLLGYGLFRDAGRTLNWGLTAGTDTVAGIGNGSAQAFTVYGRAAAAQYVAPGAYSDTIIVTIAY